MWRMLGIAVGTLATAFAMAAEENRAVIGVDPLLSEGAEALRLGEYARGLELTLEGLRGQGSRRTRVAALSNACAGLAALGRYDEALGYCDEAAALSPGRWQVHNNRALALLGKGDRPGAQDAVAEGLRLNPDSPTLQRVAAMIADGARLPAAVMADRGTD